MLDPDAEYWLWVCMALSYYVSIWFIDTSPAPWWVWLGGGWIAFPPPKLQYPVTSPPTPPVV